MPSPRFGQGGGSPDSITWWRGRPPPMAFKRSNLAQARRHGLSSAERAGPGPAPAASRELGQVLRTMPVKPAISQSPQIPNRRKGTTRHEREVHLPIGSTSLIEGVRYEVESAIADGPVGALSRAWRTCGPNPCAPSGASRGRTVLYDVRGSVAVRDVISQCRRAGRLRG